MSDNNFDDYELGGDGFVSLPAITTDTAPKGAFWNASDFAPIQTYNPLKVGNCATCVPEGFVPEYRGATMDTLPADFDPTSIWNNTPKAP